jgi:hypothetical protein
VADNNADIHGGDAFASYFAERETEATITVHQGGTIEIHGLITGQEAVNLLQHAAHLLQRYIDTRPVEGVILKSDIPGGDEISDIPF